MKTFSIAGGLSGPPSACSCAPNRIDVFAVGPGATVWRWSWDGSNWSAPAPLPGQGVIPAEGLCAVSSGPGRVEVFAVANTGAPVWWRGNGTQWTPGAALQQVANLPAVPVAAVCASPDNIDVFGAGARNTPWWWHWNGSWWTAQGDLTGGANIQGVRLAAVSAAAGRLDVFAAGAGNHLWRWSKVGTEPWRLDDLGGNLPAHGVSAVSWGPDRIDVFAASRAPGNPLQHWWSAGGPFVGPEPIGGSFADGTVSAVSHAADRLDIFGISRDRRIAHVEWKGRGWSDPDYYGDDIPAGDVTAVVRKGHRLDVFVTGAGNTLRQWWRGGVPENVTPEPWVNWPGNHPTNTAGRLRPESLQELVNIVREAERLGRSVRAVGSSWSNSDVAVSPGYVVETDGLSAVLTDVLRTSVHPAGARGLVHVEGGIKLDALVKVLADGNLELKTLGGSTGQSLAGAVSTSVHGMDVDRGPLPDMVRAIHLVGPGGVQHWIEPSSRIITEKEALKNALGLTDESIHYDDEWFYSVLVSMGSLGIIYSLIIEVDPQYALRQTRAHIDWADIRARLAGTVNNPLDTNRGVQVALSPYPRGDGTRGCYLTTRNEVPPTGLTVPPDRGWMAALFTPTLISNFQANNSLIDDGVNTVTSILQAPDDTTAWFHNLVGGSDPGPNKGLTVELLFDAGTNRYLDFVDAALEILRKAYYDEQPSLAFLGWISMRFQGRSRAYLSPQQFNRTCSIEFAAAWLTNNLERPVVWTDTPILLARIEAEGRKFGGIQHWGMNDGLDANDVARAYPSLDAWRRVRWQLTNGGSITTFDNDFTRRCGLSEPPISWVAAVCALVLDE